MREWANFMLAEVGAAAVLTGLIFIGVSISLSKILASPRLPNRALQALALLLAPLVVCSLLLVPGVPLGGYGVMVLGVGFLVWIAVMLLDLHSLRHAEMQFRRVLIGNVVMNQVTVLPYIIAGIVLLTSGSQGLYWIVPGVIFSLIKALLDAWVLLVEVHR